MTKGYAKPTVLFAILFFVLSFGCFHVADSEAFTLTAQHGNVDPGCGEAKLLLGRLGCTQLDLTCSSAVVPGVSFRSVSLLPTGTGLVSQASALTGEEASAQRRAILGLAAATIPKTSRYLFHSILIL